MNTSSVACGLADNNAQTSGVTLEFINSDSSCTPTPIARDNVQAKSQQCSNSNTLVVLSLSRNLTRLHTHVASTAKTSALFSGTRRVWVHPRRLPSTRSACATRTSSPTRLNSLTTFLVCRSTLKTNLKR